MSQEKKPKIVIVLGPTASGKTALALSVAKKFNGEIVSADSRTIFKYMDIGTGKPSKSERKMVRHHLMDVVTPEARYTLADWQNDAYRTIDTILAEKKVPFIVGGTGLYISSITDAYLIPKKKEKPRYDSLLIGIDVPRVELYARINRRVQKMIRQGLEKEITSLKASYSWSLPSMHGIGYREWKPYFSKKKSKQEVINDIQQATRNYAKRQMTWFRGIERAHTIHWVSDTKTAESLIKDFLTSSVLS